MNFRLFILQIGFVSFVVACTPKVVSKSYQQDKKLVAVNNQVKPDSTVEAFIKPYREQLDAKMNRVIGYTKTELSKSEGESPLGNFVADAILLKSNEVLSKPVDMAAVNNGGLRVAIPKGAVTVGNIFELMPFENELVVLELTGGQTKKYFEFQAQKKTHIANTRVKVSNGFPVEIFIGNIPFDSTKTYRIAMSDYMASSEAPLKDIKTTATGIKLRDLLIERFEKASAKSDTIKAKVEGRLVFE